ncbi:GntR family transcriptional regulator [Thermoclostridium stercorarium]|uniref:GntR family transcriptional regulator n=1 Tax=Thermoclostridium stercorarium TaxID=1510 RepID=UPI000B1B4EEF|nr:GntR family transcriptional regulator [Thermoclostridium stercorarium]
MVFESAWYEYRDTSMPKYVKLYYCIRREIERGNMKPGSKLPSIRQVSKELGLSSTTVENAYNQLMVEGYIYSVPQKGYFAASSILRSLTLTVSPLKKKNVMRI